MRRWAALTVGAMACGWGGGTTPDPGPPVDARCETKRQFGCWRQVPGTTFVQGAQATDPAAPNHDPAASPEEGPVREVTLSSYWIMETEVAATAVQRCLDQGACRAEDVVLGGMSTLAGDQRGAYPANQITWQGAVDTCAFLG